MSLTILALDTSTEACSVALLYNDKIIENSVVSERDHTKKILPMITELLNNAGIALSQVDAIAFGVGPGSFTGVRIGIGIAQGLALGINKPLLPVSTLITLAEGAYRAACAVNVLVAIDARMGEVYFGQYQRGKDGAWIEFANTCVTGPEKVASIVQEFTHNNAIYCAGTGWQTYPDMLPHCLDSSIKLPEARDMLAIAKQMYNKGLHIKPENVEPIYLRNEVTWKKLPGR